MLDGAALDIRPCVGDGIIPDGGDSGVMSWLAWPICMFTVFSVGTEVPRKCSWRGDQPFDISGTPVPHLQSYL